MPRSENENACHFFIFTVIKCYIDPDGVDAQFACIFDYAYDSVKITQRVMNVARFYDLYLHTKLTESGAKKEKGGYETDIAEHRQ